MESPIDQSDYLIISKRMPSFLVVYEKKEVAKGKEANRRTFTTYSVASFPSGTLGKIEDELFLRRGGL